MASRAELARTLAEIEKELTGVEGAEGARARVVEIRKQIASKRQNWLYNAFEAPAHYIKIALQMAIGVVATILIVRLVWTAKHDTLPNNLPTSKDTLNVIGDGLAVAAAVELAFALFTDGPDEAVEPLILGVAAAMAIQLAGVGPTTQPVFSWVPIAYAVVLLMLFVIRSVFVHEPEISSAERFLSAWNKPYNCIGDRTWRPVTRYVRNACRSDKTSQ